MRVIVATNNHGKLLEFREALEPLGWELLSLNGFDVKLPPEDGFSYEENAFIKAAFTSAVTGIATIADDSGLEVDALDGAPGLYSARYGNKDSDLERNLYLLTNLSHVPMPRKAKFVSVIALAFPDGRCETYRGECHGEILEGPRGEAIDRLVEIGIDEDGGERGLSPGVCIERRDAHQSMHAVLRAQKSERPVAFDQ